MSAKEIIEEIQKLPQTEREKVFVFIDSQRAKDVRYASDADFYKAAEQIMSERSGLFRRLAQ